MSSLNALAQSTPLQLNLKLSAPAHQGLCSLAREAGFIQSSTNKGLGQYLDAVCYGPWHDSRDPQLQALPHGPQAWLWSLEYPRERYRIALTAEAFKTYLHVAARFGIGLRYTAPASIVGATLEAIGLQMLSTTSDAFKAPLWRPAKEVQI
jgi:hypothetical protein